MNTVSSNNSQNPKPSFWKNTGAAIAGGALGGVVALPQAYISPKLVNAMQNVSNELSADEFAKISEATSQILSKTKLDEKGVKIFKGLSIFDKAFLKTKLSEINKNVKNKHIRKLLKICDPSVSPMVQCAIGKNAFFIDKPNCILLPAQKLSLSVFHEVGHAMNYNFSKIGKLLQKTRVAGFIATGLIALTALFKTKKAIGEKTQGWWDKTTTFIKENAGKLTFVSLMPMFIEECMATVKGNKLAKEMLSSDLAKKVVKSNKFGLLSYLGLASFSALSIWAGVKIKDAIAGHKNVNKNNNIER